MVTHPGSARTARTARRLNAPRPALVEGRLVRAYISGAVLPLCTVLAMADLDEVLIVLEDVVDEADHRGCGGTYAAVKECRGTATMSRGRGSLNVPRRSALARRSIDETAPSGGAGSARANPPVLRTRTGRAGRRCAADRARRSRHPQCRTASRIYERIGVVECVWGSTTSDSSRISIAGDLLARDQMRRSPLLPVMVLALTGAPDCRFGHRIAYERIRRAAHALGGAF